MKEGACFMTIRDAVLAHANALIKELEGLNHNLKVVQAAAADFEARLTQVKLQRDYVLEKHAKLAVQLEEVVAQRNQIERHRDELQVRNDRQRATLHKLHEQITSLHAERDR